MRDWIEELMTLSMINFDDGGEGAVGGGGEASGEGMSEGGEGTQTTESSETEFTNSAKGGIVNITDGLEEGTEQTEGQEQTEEAQEETQEGQEDLPSEISLDEYDEVFDWEEGEKELMLGKMKEANITPDQFKVFKEMTGGILETVSEMQTQNEKLQGFIKKDFVEEGQKLKEANWTKADVQEILKFSGDLLGEGGAEKLSNSVNSADVLFVLKAMKDKLIGSDNALETVATNTEPVYKQEAFVQDIQKYYKMVAESNTDAPQFLASIKERARRHGDENLKRDIK